MRLGVAQQQEPALAGRLAWVTALRLLFLLALLGAVAFFFLRGELTAYPASMRVVFGTFAFGFALTVVYALLLRGGIRRTDRLAFLQIALDQVTWTAIVWVSGGVSSGATSLYGLTCVLGAILVGVRGALVAAVSSVALYGLLALGLATHVIAGPHDQPPHAVNFYPLLVNSAGIVVVAVLAGYLAERLRATGGALEEATRRYHEAARLAELGRLASWLAHEIRNPLGSIRGSIEMLRESPSLSEEDRVLCGIVFREASRLNDLVGDMLDLSAQKKPIAEAVDVAVLAKDVALLAARTSEARVEYEGAESALARCDGAQMRQVTWNLVRNALQASPAGGKVTVKVDKHDGRVTLSVRDRGPGIAESDAARIFDAFYTTRAHGAGIGLAVVKKIIDDHAPMGATITVERGEGGRGACFRVTLRADVTGLRSSIAPTALRAS